MSIEKPLALNNVIILIKSVLNKDQNHYYYNIFLEKFSYKLIFFFFFFDSILLLRFGKGKAAKKKFHSAKETINNWDVNIDKTVIWKSIEVRTISKYLIGCLDKFIGLPVLIIPKMIGFH